MLLRDQFQYGDKCGACAMDAQVYSTYKFVMKKHERQCRCLISVPCTIWANEDLYK